MVMDVSIRELRANTKEIIDTVNRGVTVIVKSHGRARVQMISVKHVEKKATHDPAFGMWKDRHEFDDVKQYVRKLREGRKI